MGDHIGGRLSSVVCESLPVVTLSHCLQYVTVGWMVDIEKEFVHLARLALDGRMDDVAALTRRTLGQVVKKRPDLAKTVKPVLEQIRRMGPTRGLARPIPIDTDSRLELLRVETVDLAFEPVWPAPVQAELGAIAEEREKESALRDAGLSPTRTALFVGAPGVGKTLAAQWLARELGRPLLTLDLAAVMSSFLGRTGNNIRAVLDFAQRQESVLLLDEFDAIAKRRDDNTEVGELKRLVTVLLQAVDDWPTTGILIAATNHPELLDPAVWRRFERVVQFPLPTAVEIQKCVDVQIPDKNGENSSILAALLEGESFAEVERTIKSLRRQAILSDVAIEECVRNAIISLSKGHSLERKIQVALVLTAQGFSQRKVAETIGVSRDTIRKYTATSRGTKG